MRASLVLLILALAACGSSTEPNKAGDPSLLITNNMPADYVFVTWQDGNAIIGRDSVAPHTANQCVRFTAQPDSAKWLIVIMDSQLGVSPDRATSTLGGAWFNPADRPAWDVEVNPIPNGSPLIFAWDSAAAASGPVYGRMRDIPTPC
jgi:hypothetical protein